MPTGFANKEGAIFDVAVIGAGMTGCSAAWRLAQERARVVVIDSGEVNAAASGANAGSLHVQIPHDPFVRHGDEWAREFAKCIPLLVESIDIWREAATLIGADLEVDQPGGLLIATNAGELRDIERKAALERSWGVDIEILDRAETLARAPYISSRVVGAAFCAIEGKANPLVCAPAFAEAAIKHGAKFETGRAVRALTRTGAGWRLDTDKGPIEAAIVINAAGAACGEIAAMVGLSVPVEAFAIQLAVTAPAPPVVKHLVYAASEKLTLKQLRQGSVVIGGGWPARIDAMGRPAVNIENLARNVALAIETVPALGDLELLRGWAAYVNGNDSWLPIIGETSRAPGFFMAYMPWIGFTASLGVSRIVTDLALGRKPTTRADTSQFRPGL